ncbi:hypothetical protein GE09DRAFT_180791 [Coniochaeta sp. 2T2.1]|nr:hypothetical protein GE09DRAFT_180791 [Coniochaeta sp. 2T2.1]
MTTRTITAGMNSNGLTDGLVVPLTTVFTIPEGLGCTLPIRMAVLSCAPPHFHDVWRLGFYSPGVCPSGYTIGCTYENQFGTPWSITRGETAGLCVPSSYICDTNADWAVPGLIGDGTSVEAIKVRWQSSDLSVLAGATSITTFTSSTTQTSSPSSPSPTQGPAISGPTASSTTTTTSSTPSPSPASQPPTSSPLSVGARVGIGVGAAGVFLLLVAFLWIWHRRRQAAARHASEEADASDHGIPELEGKRRGHSIYPPAELYAGPPPPGRVVWERHDASGGRRSGLD